MLAILFELVVRTPTPSNNHPGLALNAMPVMEHVTRVWLQCSAQVFKRVWRHLKKGTMSAVTGYKWARMRDDMTSQNVQVKYSGAPWQKGQGVVSLTEKVVSLTKIGCVPHTA